ncbi:urocortin [Pelodiscus sinensis]|uniref:urocortin n=1 Tax=Pelodiscus sinensis TaxID=13735 RepID=UPI003F6D4FC8
MCEGTLPPAARGTSGCILRRPATAASPEAEAMRIRLISAASVLVLLCLPPENCSPLELRREAAPPLALVPEPAWDLWPRRAGPGGPAAGLPSLQRLCEAGGPELRRKGRSPAARRRDGGRPNSLDLTFHLLREFLEMSREERLAQKALSNKLLLQSIGK